MVHPAGDLHGLDESPQLRPVRFRAYRPKFPREFPATSTDTQPAQSSKTYPATLAIQHLQPARRLQQWPGYCAS